MHWMHLLADNAYVKNLNAGQLLGHNKSSTIGGALTNIVDILIFIVGLLSVTFIIVGALQMVASAGSPQRFRQARETVIYAIVGIVVSIAAYAIVTFVSKAFSG